jgi:predicted transposase YdaD
VLQIGRQEGVQIGRQEGVQIGRQEGVQIGRQEGVQQGEASLLIRILIRRCGNLNPSQLQKVRSLSIAQLESLGEALLDFQSINDLDNWLENS